MANRRIRSYPVDRARSDARCGVRPFARPSRFYTLTSTAIGGWSARRRLRRCGRTGHGPGRLSTNRSSWCRSRRTASAIQEFERWASPLDEGIARAVAGNLAVLLGTTQVATVPLPPGFAPAYQAAIDVQRFESKPGSGVLVDAVWVVRKSAGGDPRMGRTVASETVRGEDFDALAAAHSRALAKVSGDIATAIRAAAATKP